MYIITPAMHIFIWNGINNTLVIKKYTKFKKKKIPFINFVKTDHVIFFSH